MLPAKRSSVSSNSHVTIRQFGTISVSLERFFFFLSFCSNPVQPLRRFPSFFSHCISGVSPATL